MVRHAPRDAAIIELLLQTGLRLSEIARLTLDDVELPQKVRRPNKATGDQCPFCEVNQSI